jgi:hypothetical protein
MLAFLAATDLPSQAAVPAFVLASVVALAAVEIAPFQVSASHVATALLALAAAPALNPILEVALALVVALVMQLPSILFTHTLLCMLLTTKALLNPSFRN